MIIIIILLFKILMASRFKSLFKKVSTTLSQIPHPISVYSSLEENNSLHRSNLLKIKTINLKVDIK